MSFSASSMTAAPGETVSVSMLATFDTAGAGAGVFGGAGLYGFGGDVNATGAASGDVSGAMPMLNASLDFGPVANSGTGTIVNAAAGRGLNGGIASGPVTLMTFDLVIDAAADGDITLDYDGAVVLVLGSDLETFSTNPGVNQSTLSTTPLTITVGAGRLCADVNGDGSVTPTDFGAWLSAFNSGNLLADANQDGSVSPTDFGAWLAAFNQGAGGPTCNP